MRPSRLGSRARQAAAAERLHANDRTDHVAIDVGVAYESSLEYFAPERFEPCLHSQGEAIIRRPDRGKYFADVARSIAHRVQQRTELRLRQLGRVVELDQMRRHEAAVNMRLIE